MRTEHDDLSRYLDGELPYDALPEELKGEADRFDRVAAVLRTEERLPPAVRAHVMARVRALAGSPWRRSWAWATRPKTVRFSPATGALALAAAIGAVLLVRPSAAPVSPTGMQARASVEATRFIFIVPNARSVAVTGDFVNWDPEGVPLRPQNGDGVWVAELELPPGLYHYVFVIDGTEWRLDPRATSQVDDGFGEQNSVLLVAPRAAS